MNQALVIIHLLGLAAGFASGIGNAVVGARMKANPGEMLALRALPGIFARIGLVGLGLLWLTGLILVWTAWDGPGAMPTLFWVKMAAVVVFTGVVLYTGQLIRAAQGGDMGAAKRAPVIGRIGGSLAVLAVILAVYAFN